MAISTVNSGRVNFEMANQLFHSVALPNQQTIPDEYDALQSYLDELNPGSRNYGTLPEHRKITLEKKISQLFKEIELKLHPIHLSTSEILKNQYDAVQALMRGLPSLSSPKQFHLAIKELHPELQQKIYYAAWLASGANPVNRSGHTDLETPGILQRKFPPLFAFMEGTLLEQISADLWMEHQRALHQENGEQQQLEHLTQQRDNDKKIIFETLFKEIKTNNFQMQALFDTLPNSVKTQVPQPPYYGRGFDPELYNTLGAHYDNTTGKTMFRVYAPHAREIKLNLTAWGNVEHTLQMIKKEDGVWEVQTGDAKPGRSYHFMIVGKNGGAPFKKIDPFAFGNIIHRREPPGNHESIVRDIHKEFNWTDNSWITTDRVKINPAKTPIVIYEIHPPTWKKQTNGNPLNWRDLAVELSNYCKDIGYTHVELMALLEHPQPVSMGYQVTSFFTPNSDMGSIEDLQYFVNYLHEQKIGVIADWIPAHFAIDEFSLCSFDGTPLFEDDNPHFASHPEWGTYEFDFKKQFTKDFLGSNLEYILREFHFDAVRVDGVQSMLNLSYGRKGGSRVNTLGTEHNLDAKTWLRNINTFVHNKHPGVLMIAEEAGGFPNLTRPVTERGVHTNTRGVGFDLTWHMWFMTKVLDYFSIPPHLRTFSYDLFSSTIKDVDYSEDCRPRGHVVLAFSHDEFKQQKGSPYAKMGGRSAYEKFASARVWLAYHIFRGGGGFLDFMGTPILQTEEWHWRLIRGLTAVQWELLYPSNPDHKYHIGVRESRKALLRLYRDNPGLQDQTDAGISWIDGKDSENCVLSIHRRGGNQQFACIFNTSDRDLQDYMIPLPNASYAPELDRLVGIKEVYNTDDVAFGGEGRLNASVEIIRDSYSNRPTHLRLRLPPCTAVVLEEQFS